MKAGQFVVSRDSKFADAFTDESKVRVFDNLALAHAFANSIAGKTMLDAPQLHVGTVRPSRLPAFMRAEVISREFMEGVGADLDSPGGEEYLGKLLARGEPPNEADDLCRVLTETARRWFAEHGIMPDFVVCELVTP